MKLTSPAFAEKLPIPEKYTCKGSNVSPPLEFLSVPSGTKSMALIVEDIDSANQWIHWLVYNIPGTTSHFDEGKIPNEAVNGICSGGTLGYEGPCPKNFKGLHRFCFTLYALDTVLDFPGPVNTEAVLTAMQGHLIEKARLSGVTEGEQA